MIYFNFALYGSLLFVLIRRANKINLSILIVSIWTVSAFFGIFYINSPLYREGRFPITMEPFVYLFICLVIAMIPFFRQRTGINKIICNNKFLINISYGFAVLSIMPLIESFFLFGKLIINGQFYMLGANYADVALGNTTSLIKYSWFSERCMIILNYFKLVTPILFYYFVQNKSRNKTILIGLFAASFVPVFTGLAIGGKTQLTFFCLYFLGLYLFLQSSLSNDSRKFIKRILIILGSIAAVLIIVLSIGRYVIGSEGKGSEGPQEHLFQYFSESMLNFNQNAFHETVKLNGMQSAQPLLLALGLTKVPIEERREFISHRIYSPAHIFYSLFGDLYLDYGSSTTLVILIILAIAFCQIKTEGNIMLYHLVLMGIYIFIMVNSLFYFSFKVSYAPIYGSILFAIFLKFFEKRTRVN